MARAGMKTASADTHPLGPRYRNRERRSRTGRDGEKGSTMTPGRSPARNHPKDQDPRRPSLTRVSDFTPSHSHPPPVYRPAAQTFPAPARRRLNVLRSRRRKPTLDNPGSGSQAALAPRLRARGGRRRKVVGRGRHMRVKVCVRWRLTRGVPFLQLGTAWPAR